MEEIKLSDALLDEYRRVKFEKDKGATVYGLFAEPIDDVLARLERQLKGLDVNLNNLV